jgi:D-inositol-3-phosphate glycosyltransferase
MDMAALRASPKLRALVLTGDFYPEQVGGQGIYAFEVACRAAELGVDVTVVCPETPERKAHRYPDGLRVIFLKLPSVDALTYTAYVTPLVQKLVRNADLVHVNELFGFTAPLLRGGRGLIVSSHNSYLDRMHAARGLKKLKYPPLLLLERLSYGSADRLIIGSEIERAPMRQLGVAEDRIVEIPYGVDVDGFFDDDGARRRRLREKLGVPADAVVALFVGRFVERKKPTVVARAFRELCARRPEFHGLLVGDGDEMADVRAIASGEPRLHLLGAVPYTDLSHYYAAADVFTLPSVGEGSISLVVLEAAAAGLPLVLTDDSCGQSKVFEAGQNGELVKLGDVDDLVRGLSMALENRARYGAHSRDLVVRHFSWDACARATVRLYEEVAALRPRPVPWAP